MGTTYKTIWKAQHIYFLDNVLYYYSLRPDSIMTSKWNLQSLRQWFEMHLQLYNEILNKGYPKEQLDSFFQKIALTYCIKKRIDFTDDYYIISANMIRKPGLCYKKCSWKQNVLIKLFQFSPTLFDLTCMLLKKHVD